MANKLTVGKLARETGLSAKTIRFYEDEGLLPRARRNESGYRLYGSADVTRLQLVRRLKLLGVRLPQIKALAEQAFADDCTEFGAELIETISRQRIEVQRRVQELQTLKAELDALEEHVCHCCDGCSTEEMASSCGFCGLINEEKGGDNDGPDR